MKRANFGVCFDRDGRQWRSTRKVAQITEALCGTHFTKSTVSVLCQRLDPIVEDWNHRPLSDHPFPFVLVDTVYLKVREDGRVRSREVMIAIGFNTDGYREVLGIMTGDTESETSSSEFFGWLIQRGLSDVDLITADDHGGLVRAIRQHFQGITWQRLFYTQYPGCYTKRPIAKQPDPITA